MSRVTRRSTPTPTSFFAGYRARDRKTARQLEVALGDIDQIGIEQIEEWLAWAIDSGLVESTGGGLYNIATAAPPTQAVG